MKWKSGAPPGPLRVTSRGPSDGGTGVDIKGGMEILNALGLEMPAPQGCSDTQVAGSGGCQAAAAFGPLLDDLLSSGQAEAGKRGTPPVVAGSSTLTAELLLVSASPLPQEALAVEDLGGPADYQKPGADGTLPALGEALAAVLNAFSGAMEAQTKETHQGERGAEAPSGDGRADHAAEDSGTAPAVSYCVQPDMVVQAVAQEGDRAAPIGPPPRVKSPGSAEAPRVPEQVRADIGAGESSRRDMAPACADYGSSDESAGGPKSTTPNAVSQANEVQGGPAPSDHAPSRKSAPGNPRSPEDGTEDGPEQKSVTLLQKEVSPGGYVFSEKAEPGAGGADHAGGGGVQSSHAGTLQTSTDVVPLSADTRIESSALTTPKPVPEPVRTVEIPEDRFLVVRQDQGSVEVSVRVENLGKLQIELSMDDGVVNAQIQTSDAAAKSVIESNLGELIQNLTREGVSIGNLAVSLRERREPSGEASRERTGPEPSGGTALRPKGPSAPQGLVSIYA